MAQKNPDTLTYDITAMLGDNLSVNIGWKPNNVYADFTGSTAIGQIKVAKTDAVPAASFTIVLGNAAGNIQFGLSAAEVAAMGVGKWVYDIQITTGALVRTYIVGKLKIIQDTSR